MKFFLNDSCRVIFPGAVLYGVFGIEENIDSSCKLRHSFGIIIIGFIFFMLLTTGKPLIRAIGFTRIWKPNTNNEIDEYSMFFEDEVVLSPDEDLFDSSLDDEFRGVSIY